MKNFGLPERLQALENFKGQTYDLIIVGGGITGAGAARDAAMRGMKVALVESSDFASGTSSRSSKLIHGGIRYLENFEFKLVFEALNERTRLFEMTPHLVHPLRFMIPLYKDSRVGMIKMGLGMWFYDALALFQAPEMHERLNPRETFERNPIVKRDQLCGSYIYSDAYMDDDRLVHETLRSAHDHGADIANYVRAEKVTWDSTGNFESLECTDQLTGHKIHMRARHLISSVGPWTDLFGNQIQKNWKKILRPTKGIHITLQRNRLPLETAVVMAAEKSSRIVFAIPRHEMVIIGTTDTDYKADPNGVVATAEDVEYLLTIANSYFPEAKLTEQDIVATYAGVRPLVADASESEGKTSREHSIWSDKNVTYVAGGKYTTYRLMAQQVVDQALQYFSLEERVHFKNADTAVPLNKWTGEEAYQSALSHCLTWKKGNLSELEVRTLVERYGFEAQALVETYGEHLTYWQIEAKQAIEQTMCLGLVDFYTRRVPLVLADPSHGLQYLEDISSVFSYSYKWDAEKLRAEVQELYQHLKREMPWRSSEDWEKLGLVF